jgi:hypothetical protein
MRGDLLLFPRRPGHLVDWAIAAATHGPYCHVAIDLGGGTILQATHEGVHLSDLPTDRRYARLSPAPGANVGRGLQEVLRFKGDRYGWFDILSQAFKFCGLDINLGKSRTVDCSHLAALYCLASGALDLGDLEPQMVSPNDLARCARLL